MHSGPWLRSPAPAAPAAPKWRLCSSLQAPMNPDHRSLERLSTPEAPKAPGGFPGRAQQVPRTGRRLTRTWKRQHLQTQPVSPGSWLAPVNPGPQHIPLPARSSGPTSPLAHLAATSTRGCWPEAVSPGPPPPPAPYCPSPQAAHHLSPGSAGGAGLFLRPPALSSLPQTEAPGSPQCLLAPETLVH